MTSTLLSPTVRSEFPVLGRGPVILKEMEAGNWLVRRLEYDSTMVPVEAVMRLQRLHALGVHPDHYLIAHEVRQPVKHVKRQVKPWIARSVWKAIGSAVGIALLAVAAAAAIVIVVTVVAALLTVIALVAAVLSGVAILGSIDPVLVAVLDDGTWIEVCRWDD